MKWKYQYFVSHDIIYAIFFTGGGRVLRTDNATRVTLDILINWFKFSSIQNINYPVFGICYFIAWRNFFCLNVTSNFNDQIVRGDFSCEERKFFKTRWRRESFHKRRNYTLYCRLNLINENESSSVLVLRIDRFRRNFHHAC